MHAKAPSQAFYQNHRVEVVSIDRTKVTVRPIHDEECRVTPNLHDSVFIACALRYAEYVVNASEVVFAR